MRRVILLFCLSSLVSGCNNAPPSGGKTSIKDTDITDVELEAFFRSNPVDGNIAVAMKKRGEFGDSYLGTIHGYPNNMSVCQDLIAPYNDDPSKSVIAGLYYCELLR